MKHLSGKYIKYIQLHSGCIRFRLFSDVALLRKTDDRLSGVQDDVIWPLFGGSRFLEYPKVS